MTEAFRTGKWIGGLYADTPCVIAARRMLRRRLRAVDQLVEIAGRRADEDPEYVHQLRVSSMRSLAALRAFRAYCDSDLNKRIRRRLRRIRRVGAAARRNDVLRDIVAKELPGCIEPSKAAIEEFVSQLTAERRVLQEGIVELADEHRALGRRRRIQRLLSIKGNATRPDGQTRGDVGDREAPYTLGGLAAVKLTELLHAIQERRGHDLNDPLELHDLRIAGKELRYVMEIFAGSYSVRLRDELYPRIETMIGHLGELNDWFEAAQCAGRHLTSSGRESATDNHKNNGRSTNGGIVQLAQLFRERYERRHREFLDWWGSRSSHELFEAIEGLIHGNARSRRAVLRDHHDVSQAEEGVNTGAHNVRSRIEFTRPALDSTFSHRRVAAIDVGTNSIRLVVGETDPLTKFRVIEDMKETTRLGSGVFDKGRIGEEASEASARAIERMKEVALSCRVDRIRAVATSAVREAANRAEFLSLVERRTGIRIEVIDPEHEARLAFSSVANTFELDDRRVAIADIGGGSTELVLSSGGVIDHIHPLALGAVRLTERFGVLEGREPFEEMRRVIDKAIHERLGATSYQPYLIIGTGGTFTSLARVAIRHGSSAAGSGWFPFAVRGYELRHGEVAYLLEYLRRMSQDDRRKVPGLSGQRAEIIVAGICIVERLMQYYGADRVRVHDGGIRDGLIAQMIDDLGFQSETPRRLPPTSLDSVRRFAERCRYDKPHSEHVANLSLRIFDQLAAHNPDVAGAWGHDEGRHLLQASAILHDVGIAVGYRRHHKHSYDMVMHADLPGYTRREIEIIANTCRYHRRGGPQSRHATFRRLGDDDQRLVTHMVGILRIADGLDRLHRQDVVDVTVTPGVNRTIINVIAEAEPRENIKAARDKAGVFAETFQTRVRFVWTAASDVPPPTEVQERQEAAVIA